MNEEAMPMQEEEPEPTPMDQILSTLDSYIANPALATKETLAQLKDQLMSVKEFTDGEVKEEPAEVDERPGLMISIGKK